MCVFKRETVLSLKSVMTMTLWHKLKCMFKVKLGKSRLKVVCIIPIQRSSSCKQLIMRWLAHYRYAVCYCVKNV